MTDLARARIVPTAEVPVEATQWQVLPPGAAASFDSLLPDFRVRLASADIAEAIVDPSRSSANAAGGMHGAYLAAVAEKTLFLPLFLKGSCTRAGNVTVDFTLQYVAGGDPALPLDAQIELLRETGRLGFVRGLLRQQGTTILAYSGTVRKLRA